MKLSFKTITIIIGVILLFLLLNKCSRNTIIRGLGGYTENNTKTVVDTFRIKGKVDTTEIFYGYVKTHGIRIGKDSIIYKYKYKDPVTGSGEVVDSVIKFSVNVTDEFISGEFNGINSFNGKFILGELNYTRKFPKYITRVDTLRINTHTTTTLKNSKERFGIGVGVNTLMSPSAIASWTNKKNWQFMYEYNHIFKGTNLILNNNDIKNIHGIKIIKNF